MTQKIKEVKDMKSHEIARAQAGDISSRVRERELRVIQKDEEVIRSLMPDTDSTRRQYPESEFRRHFLPVFSGEAYKNLPEGYTAQQLNDDAHRYWIQVAGSAHNEVEVTEPDGSVAFIVPALSDTSVLKISQPQDDAGLRHLQKEVLERVQGLPHVASRQMMQGLERKIAYMTSNSKGDEIKAVKRISEIRKYYDLEDTSLDTVKSKAEVNFMGDMDFD